MYYHFSKDVACKERESKMYHVKLAQGLQNLPEARTIRTTVFVQEQGFQNEFDEIDSSAYVVVVYDKGIPIATGRAFPKDKDLGTYIIGRVAVIKEYRKKHIGSIVIDELEKKCKELGANCIEISAQVQAQGFYNKRGYVSYGETYLDEHCPHISMKKQL